MSVNKTKGMRRVVVTGVGMVTSMGMDVSSVWQKLLAGESGIELEWTGGNVGDAIDPQYLSHADSDDYVPINLAATAFTVTGI